MERIKHIVQLFETGLDSEDCVGYHGTSLESMEYIVNNGVLLGRLYGASREIYFFPFKSKFQNHPLRDTFPDEHDVIERTSQYAGQNAESHYLIRLLDLDIENAKDYVESLMLSEGDYFMDEILKKHPKLGFRRSNLLKIIHEAEILDHKMYFSKKMLEEYLRHAGFKQFQVKRFQLGMNLHAVAIK